MMTSDSKVTVRSDRNTVGFWAVAGPPLLPDLVLPVVATTCLALSPRSRHGAQRLSAPRAARERFSPAAIGAAAAFALFGQASSLWLPRTSSQLRAAIPALLAGLAEYLGLVAIATPSDRGVARVSAVPQSMWQ
jgi:hypothetical protein